MLTAKNTALMEEYYPGLQLATKHSCQSLPFVLRGSGLGTTSWRLLANYSSNMISLPKINLRTPVPMPEPALRISLFGDVSPEAIQC